MSSSPLVLVPGYWLGGWAWDPVARPLREAGHPVHAVTLPGLESADTDRGTIRLADHVTALGRRLAAVGSDAVVVAHSGAGKVVSAVLDADPGLVRRVVYVDSGPAGDGTAEDVPSELVELPLPSWDTMRAQGTSLEGLGEADLAAFRARAVPHPAAVARDPVHLRDPARRRVPSTIVACSIPAALVAELAAAGDPMFAEVAELDDVGYLELPTGHWPMWSRPDDLARLLLQAAG